jgi:trehalose 6-phosphate synthase
VLSEFAGAAAEFEDAFLVNPHDVDGLKETLLRAMEATPADLERRMTAMREHLARHDILAWARAYLTALDHSGRLAAGLRH